LFFETKDLIVDRLSLLDAEDFHRVSNKPFVFKWMDDWKMDIKDTEDLLQYFISGYDVNDPEQVPFIFAIRTTEEKFIGICGFGPKDELGGDAEIAFFIDEDYAGKGYMSQVVEKAIPFYFSLTNKPYLCALVDNSNIPSKSILTKYGFSYNEINDPDGILKSHYRLYNTE
jgi:RimJ/RimL family protein N-acetyltransferase